MMPTILEGYDRFAAVETIKAQTTFALNEKAI
jgi:hypothetical protein